MVVSQSPGLHVVRLRLRRREEIALGAIIGVYVMYGTCSLTVAAR